MIKSLIYVLSLVFSNSMCLENVVDRHRDMIHEHNMLNKSWTLGENKFVGMSDSEFRYYYKGYSGEIPTTPKVVMNTIDKVCYPTSIDWVDKGAVSSVKDQESCGSCWAFSATGAVEGLYAIQTGRLVDFSEQDIVDCDTGGNGCGGGEMQQAFSFIQDSGICLEKDYIYNGVEGECKCCTEAYKIQGSRSVSSGSYSDLLTSLLKQPISVAIEADQESFRFYSGGIYDGDCGTNLDHGVLLVGYGEENGKKYWKVKNSWGNDWGEEGYIRMARDEEDGSGICGIQLDASYPF